MKLALPTSSAAAIGTAEPVHGMGMYQLCPSTGLAMPGAGEGDMPGAVTRSSLCRHRRETDDNLSAGASCPRQLEEYNT